jgi:hypothetical protein
MFVAAAAFWIGGSGGGDGGGDWWRWLVVVVVGGGCRSSGWRLQMGAAGSHVLVVTKTVVVAGTCVRVETSVVAQRRFARCCYMI